MSGPMRGSAISWYRLRPRSSKMRGQRAAKGVREEHGREGVNLLDDLDRIGETRFISNQHRLSARVMLCLTKQVGRNPGRIRRCLGDH